MIACCIRPLYRTVHKNHKWRLDAHSNMCRATLQHEVDTVEDTETDDARKVPLRIYTPKSNPSKKLPVLVYFHGGGWVTGKLSL